MTSGQKIAFSLLTTIVLFSGFVLVSQSKLIPELETKYYAKSKIEEKTNQLNNIAESCDLYISNVLQTLQGSDDAYLKNPAIGSYVVQNPSEKDVTERRQLTEDLLRKNPSIEGIRLVDKNGRNVHFSTFDSTDIFKQSGISKQYKNYTDIVKDADELEFEHIKLNEQKPENRIILDTAKNRILLSLPFYWLDNIYAGSMVFYLNVASLENILVENGAISLGNSFNMLCDDSLEQGGFAIGIPAKTRKEFTQPIINSWKLSSVKKGESQLPERILQIEDNLYWVTLFTESTFFKITGVYTSDVFELSVEIKYLIYISVFITILLIVYLLFSMKADSMVTLKKRIKKIQYSVVKEYINNKEDVNWDKVVSQLKLRKKDLTTDIINSLHVHSKKKRKELDELLEKNWDEIFRIAGDTGEDSNKSITGTTVSASNGVTLDEIRRMLEEVLKTTKVNVQSVTAAPKKAAPKPAPAPVDEVEEIDEVDEIEEIDEVEEIEEAEEVEESAPGPALWGPEPPPLPPSASYEYQDDNDSFLPGEEFATTENLFAEELGLGTQCSPNWEEIPGSFEVIVYNLFGTVIDGEVEELVEELPEPDAKPYFSMTTFANNIEEIEALEGTTPETIVEQHGVYSISENLEYEGVTQDANFKALVDSVLQ